MIIYNFYKKSLLSITWVFLIGTVAAQETKKDSIRKAENLKEVEIKTRTKITEIKESPVNITVVDVKKVHAESGNLLDLINRSPGVRLRSDGYLGAPINISLNGMEGKAITLFKDGIPLSVFGHSFDPSLLSVNTLDRVEVYKGVLPVSLGADALGGAINFVSRYPAKPTVDLSYEVSSYNTHRASLTLYAPDRKNQFYSGINASFAYSDNDYKEQREYYDSPNSSNPGYERVKYLNNKTKTITAEAYVGLRHQSWADDFRFTIIGSSFYKGIPFIPFTNPRYFALHAYSDEKNITPMLRYDKKLFNNKLELNAVGSYSWVSTIFRDTSLNKYDKYGNFLMREDSSPQSRRELNGTGRDLSLDYKITSLRFNATYRINPQHALEFNNVYTSNKRIGSDPLGGITAFTDLDVYQTPASYRKNITAAGLHSWLFNHKLENMIALKHYYMNTSGFSNYQAEGGETIEKNSENKWGWMEGLSYRPHVRWLTKVSYEYAVRLPDDVEVYGDAIKTSGNFNLKPERSHNYNIQLQYNSRKRGVGAVEIMANYFIRNTSQLIQLYRDIPKSYYLNQDKVKIQGIELDIQYRPFALLSLTANATYQDVRNYLTRLYSYGPLLETPIYKGRLANTPPLFGNVQARLHFKDFLQKGSTTELYWYYSYTHRFYSQNNDDTAPGSIGFFESFPAGYANHKFWLPQDGRMGQQNHTIGIMQKLAQPNGSLSLECHNLTNQQLFDNLYVEKPGRTFHLKLTISL
ncbi:TonB-dependent receptor domain-containing protein [Pedobacter caeni]|uniref:Outer membrane receptor proteins, mostly Fe transport n=1 Tax=Pedobacter caeni TaxID=288992 RepID=A0A1M4UMN5_9SPHI|nr:TonB-dependent receptor [Pedobacter caeni]SHE57917.1 Outer membrane receptor proteins, mostly Fe transport [Pedobacter caeni]